MYLGFSWIWEKSSLGKSPPSTRSPIHPTKSLGVSLAPSRKKYLTRHQRPFSYRKSAFQKLKLPVKIEIPQKTMGPPANNTIKVNRPTKSFVFLDKFFFKQIFPTALSLPICQIGNRNNMPRLHQSIVGWEICFLKNR